MRIYYGVEGHYQDVTRLALVHCVIGINTVAIPCGEGHRCKLFGDPVPGVLKHIKVVDKNVSTICNHTESITMTIDNIKQAIKLLDMLETNILNN